LAYTYFFLPPFFAFLAVALPWFCGLLLAEPFLPLLADLAIDGDKREHFI
jgi:hypothetical protein